MKYRPGIPLLLVVGALALWAIVGLVWAPALWAIPLVAVTSAALAVLDFYRLRRGLRALTVRRRLPSPVGRDRAFDVALEVDNRGDQAWVAVVRDVVPAVAQPKVWQQPAALPAHREATVSASFRIPTRGRFTFGPAWLRLVGRFGMLEAQQSYPEQAAVQVFPESLLSPHELARDAADEVRLLDKLRNARHHGAGTEFESLEEFRAGDDPRHIDWRTTARHRRPVVRRYQIERHRDMMLLVDCGRLMGADARQGTKLDCAVDAALRLLRIALRGGDRCGLGIFADEVVGFLRPIAGANAMPTLLASLYDLAPRWHETDFGPMFATLQARLTKRALVIVLSDVADAETSGRYRTSLATLAQRHVVLFAALQTPLLREIGESPLQSIDDGFKKAVVFRIERERELAIHSLRRSGVHVLDVEPARLTVPLVNEYIELRQSSVL